MLKRFANDINVADTVLCLPSITGKNCCALTIIIKWNHSRGKRTNFDTSRSRSLHSIASTCTNDLSCILIERTRQRYIYGTNCNMNTRQFANCLQWDFWYKTVGIWCAPVKNHKRRSYNYNTVWSGLCEYNEHKARFPLAEFRGAGSPGQGDQLTPLKFEIAVKNLIPQLCRIGDFWP